MNSDSSVTSLSFSDNSLPEFESFSDHTEETRSGNTTTHANYSLPEYESFHFDNPSFPRPPPEPPNVCLDMLYNDESFEPGEGENIVVSNVEEDEDSFTFTILYISTISQLILRYGYIKNHKKTVKNGQARTRERKSAQKPEAKPRKSQSSVKQSKLSQLMVNRSQP
ncbi:hypothetical protein Tco_0734190 [Tanacetum coccineum]